MISLSGKIALVTGGTRGIGLAISTALAAAGATVVLSATTQEACDRVASLLSEQFGSPCLGLQADVSNSESVQALVSKTLEQFGAIDILVNNAGITKDTLLLRMSESDWDAVLRTNLDSVFYTTKAVMRPMLKKKAGKIINISSVVGIIGNPGQANYAASKAGMIGFSKSIAKEIGSKGITCNVIAPGFIETDMIQSLPEEYLASIIDSVPLKRLGKANDVADLVVFLASDHSNYITGQVLAVDGGLQM